MTDAEVRIGEIVTASINAAIGVRSIAGNSCAGRGGEQRGREEEESESKGHVFSSKRVVETHQVAESN